MSILIDVVDSSFKVVLSWLSGISSSHFIEKGETRVHSRRTYTHVVNLSPSIVDRQRPPVRHYVVIMSKAYGVVTPNRMAATTIYEVHRTYPCGTIHCTVAEFESYWQFELLDSAEAHMAARPDSDI
jgi:hypothetical protein